MYTYFWSAERTNRCRDNVTDMRRKLSLLLLFVAEDNGGSCIIISTNTLTVEGGKFPRTIFKEMRSTTAQAL